jgi:hypothetical protein
MAIAIQNIEIVANAHALTSNGLTKKIVNVYHYFSQFTVVTYNPTNVITAFQALVDVVVKAALNIRYVGDSTTVRVMDDSTNIAFVGAAPGTGVIATDSLPTDDAVYVRLRTTKRGRSFRGSKHYTPGSEIDTTNDELTGAGLTRWQAVATALQTPFTDGDGNVWQPGVLSATLSKLVNPTNIIMTPVLTATVCKTIGTMRRRREKSQY